MAPTTFTARITSSTTFARGGIGTHGIGSELKALVDNKKLLIDELVVAVNATEAALLEADWLDSCRLAGVGNVNIASAPANFDGQAGAADDSILLLEQTDPKENGPYVFTAAAAVMTRRTDFDESAEITSGAQVRVLLGAKHGGKAYYVSAADPITVGVTNITFARSGAPKSNFAAVTAPLVTSDLANGYEVGSLWVDTVTQKLYACVDSTTGAAVWKDLDGIHVAATIPLVTSDDAAGFYIGSRWYDTALGREYRATDVTTGAAVWEIVGEVLAITSPGVGDDDADWFIAGSTWHDAVLNITFRCVDAGTGAAVWLEAHGLHVAATIPLVTSDDAAGFRIGSRWYDTALAREFRCTDASTGAAVWEVVGQVRSAGTPAVGDDDADWFVVGSTWLDTSVAPDVLYICLNTTTGAAIWREARGTHQVAGAPTVNSDDINGFRLGDFWTDTSTLPDTIYVCLINATGAAVWVEASGIHTAAAAPTVNSDDINGFRPGDLWRDTTADANTLYFCITNATGAAVWRTLADYHIAATIPLVTSDDDAGFRIGSRWYDTALNRRFLCTDASTGAAVWEVVGIVSAAAAPVVGDDDADWFVVGSQWIDTSVAPPRMHFCTDPATGAAVWPEISGMHTGAGIPLVTSDDANGYEIGDWWFSTGTLRMYLAADVTTGAAVWPCYSLITDGAPPGVGDDDLDWLFPGQTWVDTTAGASYVLLDNATGAAVWEPIGGMLRRYTIAAESALTGAGMGATTETAHTPITLPTALLNVARRTIRFKALIHCVDDNAADTWEAKVYIGAAGLGGVEIYATGAVDNAAAELWEIHGEIYIATIGAGGTFHSVVHGLGEGVGIPAVVYVTGGAIATDANEDVTVSGWSSTNNADQEMTLVHFECEVIDA